MGVALKCKQTLIFFAFFLLLCLIRTTDPVHAIDGFWYNLAQQLSYSREWLLIWFGVTQIGDGFFVYIIVFLLTLTIVSRHRNRYGFGFFLLMLCLALSNLGFKLFFQISRPVGLASFYEELSTHTFPSGHAVNGIVIFFLVPRLYQYIQQGGIHFGHSARERVTSFFLMLFGASLISMSRVFLGVHWFSDVVTGMVWGAVIYQVVLVYLKFMIERRA